MENITLIVSYERMDFFDPMSQKSIFFVKPQHYYDYAKNGLLKCCGKIGLYENGTPIQLKGYYHLNTQMLEVEDCSIYTKTYDHSRYMLEYVSRQLTESEKSEIISIAENDVISFAYSENAVDIIFKILKKYRVDEKSDTQEYEKKRTKILAKKVCERLKKLAEVDDVAKLLMSYRIPIDKINALIKNNVDLNKVKNNAYLALQTYGIDFYYADLFSFNQTPVREYSPARLRGIVYEALTKIRESGHTFCLLRQLVKRADYIADRYGVFHTKINRALAHACVFGMDNICQYHEVYGKQVLYLNHVWEEETIAIQHLKRLHVSKKEFPKEKNVDEIEKELGISYNFDQIKAFGILNSSGVKILTGPPGSGKTSIIKGLIRSFEKNRGGKIKLAATTGRAAKVMANACGRTAETVHKMLNVVPYGDAARGRDLNNPVDADLIIVDEVSMLGLQLFSILLQAVRSDAILILVGDEDQLQSVDYGNVLHDLIDSECVGIFRLTEIVRQGGSICLNAQSIN